jgi:hypothetical protein
VQQILYVHWFSQAIALLRQFSTARIMPFSMLQSAPTAAAGAKPNEPSNLLRYVPDLGIGKIASEFNDMICVTPRKKGRQPNAVGSIGVQRGNRNSSGNLKKLRNSSHQNLHAMERSKGDKASKLILNTGKISSVKPGTEDSTA